MEPQTGLLLAQCSDAALHTPRWGSAGADAELLHQPGESRLFAATAMARFPVAAGLGRPDASLKVLTGFQFPSLLGKRTFPKRLSCVCRMVRENAVSCRAPLVTLPPGPVLYGPDAGCDGAVAASGCRARRSASLETPRPHGWAAGIQSEPLSRGCSGRSALVLVL